MLIMFRSSLFTSIFMEDHLLHLEILSEMLICSFIMLSPFNRFYKIRKKLNKLHDYTIDHFVLVIDLHMHSQTMFSLLH